MINEKAYALGANRSCIRDLFEYGRSRAAIVGAENVYDYSLGNPSIPAPDYVNQAIVEVLTQQNSLAVKPCSGSGAANGICDFSLLLNVNIFNLHPDMAI